MRSALVNCVNGTAATVAVCSPPSSPAVSTHLLPSTSLLLFCFFIPNTLVTVAIVAVALGLLIPPLGFCKHLFASNLLFTRPGTLFFLSHVSCLCACATINLSIELKPLQSQELCIRFIQSLFWQLSLPSILPLRLLLRIRRSM